MLPVFRGMVTEPENKKKVQVYCIVVCMSEERKDFLCACCNIKKHVDNESRAVVKETRSMPTRTDRRLDALHTCPSAPACLPLPTDLVKIKTNIALRQ